MCEQTYYPASADPYDPRLPETIALLEKIAAENGLRDLSEPDKLISLDVSKAPQIARRLWLICDKAGFPREDYQHVLRLLASMNDQALFTGFADYGMDGLRGVLDVVKRWLAEYEQYKIA